MNCTATQVIIQAKVSDTYGDADIKDTFALILSGMVEIHRDLITGIFPDVDDELFTSVEHVANCTACAKWSKSLSPMRQALLQKSYHHCCVNMFKSVEKTMPEIVFEFRHGRGSYGKWYLNNVAVDYCPWCGEGLTRRIKTIECGEYSHHE